jgi:2-polyprenyl-3-methyl-5-hydroxy-6-metoxy-1,4-benzoquinol methylase
MNRNCIACKSKKFKILWHGKIRVERNKFSKKRHKILQCTNCQLVFLKKKTIKFEKNNKIFRQLYDGDNSIKKFIDFHKPRERKKFYYFKKYLKFNNKDILESNCGYGILLELLKKKVNSTAGIDDEIYKTSLTKRGHKFFDSLDKIIKIKKKFDIIFSLSELEHKSDPILFISKIKKCLKLNGKLIIRIPNYNNIYKLIIGKEFMKFDFRLSHNYYFSEKNLDIIFKKNKLKIVKKIGIQEYSLNHLLTFFKKKERINEFSSIKYFNNQDNNFFKRNIENQFYSTSLIYILSNEK